MTRNFRKIKCGGAAKKTRLLASVSTSYLVVYAAYVSDKSI